MIFDQKSIIFDQKYDCLTNNIIFDKQMKNQKYFTFWYIQGWLRLTHAQNKKTRTHGVHGRANSTRICGRNDFRNPGVILSKSKLCPRIAIMTKKLFPL